MSKHDTPGKLADKITLLQLNIDAQPINSDDAATPRAKLASFVSAYSSEVVAGLRLLNSSCPHHCTDGRCPFDRLKAALRGKS